MKLKGILESGKPGKWFPKYRIKALFSEFGLYGSKEEGFVKSLIANLDRKGCLGLALILETSSGGQYEITPFSKFAEFSPKPDNVDWEESK